MYWVMEDFYHEPRTKLLASGPLSCDLSAQGLLGAVSRIIKENLIYMYICIYIYVYLHVYSHAYVDFKRSLTCMKKYS